MRVLLVMFCFALVFCVGCESKLDRLKRERKVQRQKVLEEATEGLHDAFDGLGIPRSETRPY